MTGALPIYEPHDAWRPSCTNCNTLTEDDSLHDATLTHATSTGLPDGAKDPEAKLSFSGTLWRKNRNLLANLCTSIGTALWVFCTIPTAQNARTRISFALDGQPAGVYTFVPEAAASSTYIYNVSVYTVTGLQNTNHTLTMSPVDGSAILFDSAIYTSVLWSLPLRLVLNSIFRHDDGSSTLASSDTADASQPQRERSTRVIDGVIAGIVLFAAIAAAIAYVVWSNRQKSRRAQGTLPLPSSAPSTASKPRFAALETVGRLPYFRRLSAGNYPQTPTPVTPAFKDAKLLGRGDWRRGQNEDVPNSAATAATPTTAATLVDRHAQV